MPLFEFRCTACGVRFESLVRREAEAVECPGCGALDVERLLSAPSAPRMAGSAVGKVGGGNGGGCCGGGCGCSH